MKHVAAVLLLAGALSGCSDEPPEVDWSEIPEYQRNVIERAVGDDDCPAMQAAFDASENADVLAYLDWHMEDAGCYE